MKIVIDIDEKYYDGIRSLEPKTDSTYAYLIRLIKYGTPFPEHHGRLIDADTFQKYCFNKNFDKRLSDGGLATINFFLGLQPTIIEGSDNIECKAKGEKA